MPSFTLRNSAAYIPRGKGGHKSGRRDGGPGGINNKAYLELYAPGPTAPQYRIAFQAKIYEPWFVLFPSRGVELMFLATFVANFCSKLAVKNTITL